MQRGFDLLVAQIAIAKTGAAWLPFDADAPVDRVAVCLQDCRGANDRDGCRIRGNARLPTCPVP